VHFLASELGRFQNARSNDLKKKKDETLLQTCNSETHSQCQYDFSCHLTKNSLCGFGLRGGRLLVDGSSDGLSSSSLFSNFFESAQRQVRILATFPGSGFAYNIK